MVAHERRLAFLTSHKRYCVFALNRVRNVNESVLYTCRSSHTENFRIGWQLPRLCRAASLRNISFKLSLNHVLRTIVWMIQLQDILILQVTSTSTIVLLFLIKIWTLGSREYLPAGSYFWQSGRNIEECGAPHPSNSCRDVQHGIMQATWINLKECCLAVAQTLLLRLHDRQEFTDSERPPPLRNAINKVACSTVFWRIQSSTMAFNPTYATVENEECKLRY